MDKIDNIRTEIEQLRRKVDDHNYYLDNSEQAVGYVNALLDIENFLDTLSEELDKSLEAEIQWYLREKCSGDDEPTVSEIARYFAKWQYQKDREEFAKIRAKIWCEGFDAHNEQMLKNAVEGVIEEASFNNGEKHNTIRFSFDEESLHVENRIWFPRSGKDGDKVRIVVLKEKEE